MADSFANKLGAQAVRYGGKSRDTNPYKKGSTSYRDWLRGFDRAIREQESRG